MSVILECVYDDVKHKLRVRPQDRNGWVQFPKGLRREGALFEVDDLKHDARGFWHVVGDIRPCTSLRREMERTERRPAPRPTVRARGRDAQSPVPTDDDAPFGVVGGL
jgi:hypothetical protein